MRVLFSLPQFNWENHDGRTTTIGLASLVGCVKKITGSRCQLTTSFSLIEILTWRGAFFSYFFSPCKCFVFIRLQFYSVDGRRGWCNLKECSGVRGEENIWWKRGNNLIGIKIAFLAMKKLLRRIMIFLFFTAVSKMMKSQRHFFLFVCIQYNILE